eukprot:764100-Hanusia_phi.AAC.3
MEEEELGRREGAGAGVGGKGRSRSRSYGHGLKVLLQLVLADLKPVLQSSLPAPPSPLPFFSLRSSFSSSLPPALLSLSLSLSSPFLSPLPPPVFLLLLQLTARGADA